MRERPKLDLGMTGYDEMFMNDQERAENRLPKIFDIPLTEIDDFPDHPFKVRLDEDMDQLVESVKNRGVITPITLRRKENGRYEIVSGHRRRKACELAGLATVPAEIKELTRDESQHQVRRCKKVHSFQCSLQRYRCVYSESAGILSPASGTYAG